MKRIIPAIVLALLAGCATKPQTTAVTSLGNGKFSVSSQGIVTTTPRSELKDLAVGQATAHCASMGKKYNWVEQIDDPEGPLARWSEVQIIFTCV